jgi:hypothetical protein
MATNFLRAPATKLCDYSGMLIIEPNACYFRFVISGALSFWIGADPMHSKLACLKKRRSVLKMTGQRRQALQHKADITKDGVMSAHDSKRI